ncbi:MAG TPA: peptidylprolyl isomerase [Gaiellaceae bacterium]|jgi:peptidyl-prolyl cis-trans isomerase A (cyclophilin A)
MTKSVFAAILAAALISGATACGGGSGGGGGSSNAQAPATFSARFDTTKGPFTVTVNRSWAPRGADRFYNLVKDHFYDNQPIFRVVPGFVVQWGISGIPSVAKKWQNATIKDDPVKHSNDKGTITFATSGADTRTTQLFVNLVNNSGLDTQGFSPFGTVTSGFPVFNKLYSGYGDNFDQGALTQGGAEWAHKHFPKLDWITTARLVQ